MNSKVCDLNLFAKYLIVLSKNKPNIILCGGNTIKKVLERIIKSKSLITVNNLLLSDERLVNTKSRYRNDLYYKNLIKKKVIKCKKFIRYKLGEYNKKYLDELSIKVSKIKFDICLLSLGKNNHIASIFDFNSKETKNYYFVDQSYKKPRFRVTISKRIIKKCKKIIIIADSKKRVKEINNLKKIDFFKDIQNKLLVILI